MLPEAIPLVSIVKDGGFAADAFGDDDEAESDLKGLIADRLGKGRLCGFVSRGADEGFADLDPLGVSIAGLNLTATKARLLLLACLIKFGGLPAAVNPKRPTAAEAAALSEAVGRYQNVFDTH